MSPLAASATCVNLILATGPFTYPYGYTALGPVISAPLLFLVAVLAYITATYLFEAISISQALQRMERAVEPDELDGRTKSLFDETCYKDEAIQEKMNRKDMAVKDSEFYIREKVEIGILAERVSYNWVKYSIIVILIVYVYGAVALKYVTGAISLQEGMSKIFTGEEGYWTQEYPWTYYIAIAIFGVLSITFSFGDIENSKTLQVVTSIMRIVTVALMAICTIYYWGADGMNKAPTISWSTQLSHLSTVFGNTVFVFIYHHSVPGIVYPIRPQSDVGNMFLIANIVGALLLFMEAQLAWYAFSGLPNSCEDVNYDPPFPCKPDPNGFNLNFGGVPVIGDLI